MCCTEIEMGLGVERKSDVNRRYLVLERVLHETRKGEKCCGGEGERCGSGEHGFEANAT